MEVFDLTQSPGLIRPAYLFDAAMVFSSVVCTVIYFALRDAKPRKAVSGLRLEVFRLRGPKWGLLVFAGIFLLGAGYEAMHALIVRNDVVHGRFQTLEGCLESFEPGDSVCRRRGGGAERWTVGGREFSFCGGAVGFGYNVAGGSSIVHPDSWVRVSYVTVGPLPSEDVVRLETRPGLCPAAPLPPAGS